MRLPAIASLEFAQAKQAGIADIRAHMTFHLFFDFRFQCSMEGLILFVPLRRCAIPLVDQL